MSNPENITVVEITPETTESADVQKTPFYKNPRFLKPAAIAASAAVATALVIRVFRSDDDSDDSDDSDSDDSTVYIFTEDDAS